MRILLPILVGLVSILGWFFGSRWLESEFGSDEFAGHLFRSPVNMFSIAAFSMSLTMIILRFLRVRSESRWLHLSLLPEETEFRSFESDVEPFALQLLAQGPRRNWRPLRLLRACFEAVRRNWTSEAANSALRTDFEVMKTETEADYHVVSFLVSAIVAIGFIGTVLGIGQSMGAFELGRDAAIAQLHVAFDTTLVALILSLIASLALSILQRFEESMLASIFRTVQHGFVLRIRESEKK